MLIDPKVAIQEGWITHPKCTSIEDWQQNKYLSSNAIDFTLDKLYGINHENIFIISELDKTMRGGYQIDTVNTDNNGDTFWTFAPHLVYDGMSDMHVKLPEGVVCQLVIRSTFNRNGIFLTSGLYDSGYDGNIGYALHNRSGMASVQKGVRIGQIMFLESKSSEMYEGGWNHAHGTHWNGDNT